MKELNDILYVVRIVLFAIVLGIVLYLFIGNRMCRKENVLPIGYYQEYEEDYN